MSGLVEVGGVGQQSREGATQGLELLHTFPLAPLAEAEGYSRAAAQLRELRRTTDPRSGYYLHLVYGDTEADAGARLLAQLG